MSSTHEQNVIWLTQVKHDELQSELEHLKGDGRAAIVQKVSEARDEGDLKENSGYHAAREELGKIDARILQLTDMLRRAQVGETPPDDGVVEPGMIVSYKFEGDDEEDSFLLGAREMAGDDLQVFSPDSPMGKAISGHKVGDTVEYEAPNGKMLAVTITAAKPYTG